MNDKFEKLIEGTRNQSRLLNDKLTMMIDRQNVQLEQQGIEIAAIRELLGTGAATGDNFSAGKSPLEAAPRRAPADDR